MKILLSIAISANLLFNTHSQSEKVEQISPTGITHKFLAMGADTYVANGDGSIGQVYPFATRDGWMLPSGTAVFAVNKTADYPGGAVVTVDAAGKQTCIYKGTQSEVDTVQPLPGGKYMLTESGPKPRLMEIDGTGKVLLEFPLQCQLENHHMQTRMARKLKNGHYLAPHLIDKAVREYDKSGKVVWEVKTPDWPFTAVRLNNGDTLINCTRGLVSLEVDKAGATVWQLTNVDLPEPIIRDACAIQRLPNGNTVMESYGANGPEMVKLFEVTPDKKIVWSVKTGKNHGIHEFQILDTNGKPLKGDAIK